jgi:hypothetical protein
MPYKIEGIEIEGIAEPYLGEGTTFVPLANVSQALGGYADFDHETKVARIEIAGQVVSIQADNPIIDISGAAVELQAAPYIDVDSMFVPVRLFERLGFKLSVDGASIALESA